jgi:hypothetical protein
MNKLILLCLVVFNASAGVSKDEQLFLEAVSTFGNNASTGAYAEITLTQTIDEKLRRELLLNRCKAFARNKDAMRIANLDYFSALEKSIDEINSLSTSNLVSSNAKSYGEMTWLLAYRDISAQNDPLRFSYHELFKRLNRNDYFDAIGDSQAELYQNIRIDMSSGLAFPNSLHDFRAILNLLSIYDEAQRAAKTLNFSEDFEEFNKFTATSFSPSTFKIDQHSKIDAFFVKNWPLINRELIKYLNKNDIEASTELLKSKIWMAQVMATLDFYDLLKSNRKFYIPPANLKVSKKDTAAILKLLNQKGYGEKIELALKNDIPSLAERLQLEGMVNTIIRENALSICNN